jgi:hypothetical protein
VRWEEILEELTVEEGGMEEVEAVVKERFVCSVGGGGVVVELRRA